MFNIKSENQVIMHHLVREKLKAKIINSVYVPMSTGLQLAEVFTKNFHKQGFVLGLVILLTIVAFSYIDNF